MRPWYYLGVGSDKHRKIGGLGNRAPQGIKIPGCSHEIARATLS